VLVAVAARVRVQVRAILNAVQFALSGADMKPEIDVLAFGWMPVPPDPSCDLSSLLLSVIVSEDGTTHEPAR
jgi:hypothetical protein